MVLAKYPCAKDNLSLLRAKLGNDHLLFGVDATALKAVLGLFDIMFFYFPHTGARGAPEMVKRSNQHLLRGFFASVHSVLTTGGEVQVVLSTSPSYSDWDVKSLVPDGMIPKGEVAVNKVQFPGYVHRLTKGMTGKLKEVTEKEPKVFLYALLQRSRRAQRRARKPAVDWCHRSGVDCAVWWSSHRHCTPTIHVVHASGHFSTRIKAQGSSTRAGHRGDST